MYCESRIIQEGLCYGHRYGPVCFVNRDFALAVIAVLFVSAADAVACSCVGNPTVEESLRSSHSVFVGKVTDIERKNSPLFIFGKVLVGRVAEWFGGKRYEPADRDYGLEVSFTVAETFRNANASRSMKVTTGFGGGDCGYPFEVGEAYLVYAWSAEGEELAVSICSRTGRVRDRAADLRVLRHGT